MKPLHLCGFPAFSYPLTDLKSSCRREKNSTIFIAKWSLQTRSQALNEKTPTKIVRVKMGTQNQAGKERHLPA